MNFRAELGNYIGTVQAARIHAHKYNLNIRLKDTSIQWRQHRRVNNAPAILIQSWIDDLVGARSLKFIVVDVSLKNSL